MADISMCEGNGCPLKDHCYRYTAPKNEHYQAYFVEVPWDTEELKCTFYVRDTQDGRRTGSRK